MNGGSTAPTNEQLIARASAWLDEIGLDHDTPRSLAGDVSPRRYLRVSRAGASFAILAFYPDEILEVGRRFERTTALLAAIGVRVPAIFASDIDAGWMAIEDLGPSTLYETRWDWSALAPRYRDALENQLRIATLPRDAVVELGSPPLDAALLWRELAPCLDRFLRPRGLLGAGGSQARLLAGLRALCDRLGEIPAVPCHRDFMARNLVPVAEAGVGVLDHQDLRLGPPAYDLASLLNDSLFPSLELEETLLGEYLPRGVGRDDYARTVAQRSLKAVGTYAMFAERGATRHLPLVAPTLGRALRHLLTLPETAEIVAPLAGAWSTAAG